MLSTRGMEAGWDRESSESATAEEDDAPASSPTTTTSSMASREAGDSSSPGMGATVNLKPKDFQSLFL